MRYLSAALVIFIDLFIAMDNDCPEEILAQKRSDIPLICEILQERMSSVHSTTSKFATAAFGVVSNLLEAEKAKKATMVSRRNSTDGKAVGEVEPVGRVLKRIAENMSSGASIKAEDSHLSAASTYSTQTQSSLAAGTSAASGSAQRPTDQASFPQSSSAKRSIDLRRASVPITDSGRYVKMPKLSPAQQPNGHQGVPETASSDPHLNLNSASSSSTLHMPSLASGSSSSTPSFAVDGDTSSSRQESFNSTIAGSYPWVPPDTQNANYTYLNNGNFVTVTPLQQTLAQGYQQQLQATPISWDTSTLFHPDPSVLLHSMGFPAARPETVLAYAPSDQPGQGPAPPDQGLQYVTQAQTNTVQTSWYSSSGEQF